MAANRFQALFGKLPALNRGGAFFLILAFFVAAAQADGLFDFQMKLAKKGNPEAQFKIGEMYETGFGVKKDLAKAQEWINKAAKQGHETARFKLLYWDIEKHGLTAANKAKFEALKAKADAGNADAQYYIGKMYANGIGVKKDADKAMGWLSKAALVGVLAAEQEITHLREEKQRQALARRRAEEKRKARLKAQKERERQKKLEEARRREALKKQQEAEAARKKAEALRKQQEQEKLAKARAEASKQKAVEAEKARRAEQRRIEARRKALLKKRAEEEKARKARFESDPCSGKSARFLSTCR